MTHLACAGTDAFKAIRYKDIPGKETSALRIVSTGNDAACYAACEANMDCNLAIIFRSVERCFLMADTVPMLSNSEAGFLYALVRTFLPFSRVPNSGAILSCALKCARMRLYIGSLCLLFGPA
jgi:hypothetical protein